MSNRRSKWDNYRRQQKARGPSAIERFKPVHKWNGKGKKAWKKSRKHRHHFHKRSGHKHPQNHVQHSQPSNVISIPEQRNYVMVVTGDGWSSHAVWKHQPDGQWQCTYTDTFIHWMRGLYLPEALRQLEVRKLRYERHDFTKQAEKISQIDLPWGA